MYLCAYLSTSTSAHIAGIVLRPLSSTLYPIVHRLKIQWRDRSLPEFLTWRSQPSHPSPSRKIFCATSREYESPLRVDSTAKLHCAEIPFLPFWSCKLSIFCQHAVAEKFSRPAAQTDNNGQISIKLENHNSCFYHGPWTFQFKTKYFDRNQLNKFKAIPVTKKARVVSSNKCGCRAQTLFLNRNQR